MKTNILILFFAIFIISSCSKKDATPTTPPTTNSYINTNAGSSWTYHEIDSSSATPNSSDYTITSTTSDTAIGSRNYHVYSYSYGGSEYLYFSGNDYYQFDSVPVSGAGNVERLYLEDNASVEATWNQTFNLTVPNVPIPVPLTVTNKIVEKGITLVVNNITYNNVIHVSTSLSSSLIASGLTSSIDSYYAPNYGLIENSTLVQLNYLGITQNVNIRTQLTSAVLK
ncbi:MAG TPA: hypothetical protein VIJ95_16060 [Hanamia sp.]